MNYWYIKATRNGNNFEEILNEIINDKSIGICFLVKNKKLPINQNELKNFCDKEIINDKDNKNSFYNYNLFLHEIKNNDFVFILQGGSKIRYICQIDGDYYYDNAKFLPHRRRIKNIQQLTSEIMKDNKKVNIRRTIVKLK